ncbi:PREDICTED: uncharacterized protein LOC105312957 [Amphimedon queenslandica]|uniref:Uncharacterized protein n=1 Tax=Amphimedon queenslandica TaxID=400682 RepID=A0A1X7UR51_AMPQE|nr:PREDICTED: uncharacterized protein LOC105312957 [Amphimedon queenslandica]|eukprot:XP_011404300.1 PREDICTED: uncharacterized protein LOC105312957 [Amphimedon queenslandica]
MAAVPVQVKAEAYKTREHPESPKDARLSALIVEAQLYQQLQEQTAQLEEFRKKVQKRLKKQRQETSRQTIVIEKHAKSEVGGEEVCPELDGSHGITVIDCRKEQSKCIQQLLSLCEKPPVSATPPAQVTLKPTVFREKPKPSLMPKPVVNQKTSSEQKRTFTNKAEAASHHLTVRRLYSAVERQQSRVNAINRQHQKEAEKRKREREEERRQIERQYSPKESAVILAERENAKQWLEMVALERRHQKLVKEKENERFCEALQFLLHEKYPDLPSLCPCHPSIWKADPMKCARNCPFYCNHSRFARELSSLLCSVTEHK